jgi:hypothetical protein
MAVADRHGLPVAVHVENATPHEVKLALPTLVRMVVPEAPQNLVGDNAYDSDQLDGELNTFGIELISPHRSNRKNKTQDLRRLRRYRRCVLLSAVGSKARSRFRYVRVMA